ncbi:MULTISPECIES: hypothetical protein [unclassified Mameliella]|uniref:hypothetical protein n=1 Tax=unclassified Mameliella TaxID=2630630 RepID=UPI00273E4076|nr:MULTISPECIES: hypothetical protein [unclassified Mameliella]
MSDHPEIHGIGEVPREVQPEQRRMSKPQPFRDSSLFWIAALVLFIVFNVGSSIFWGGQ